VGDSPKPWQTARGRRTGTIDADGIIADCQIIISVWRQCRIQVQSFIRCSGNRRRNLTIDVGCNTTDISVAAAKHGRAQRDFAALIIRLTAGPLKNVSVLLLMTVNGAGRLKAVLTLLLTNNW